MPLPDPIEEQKGLDMNHSEVDLNAPLFFEDMQHEYLKKTVALICELAIKEDEESLAELLKQIVCIDIFDKKPAVEQLAAYGNSKAVLFLIERFQSSLNYAVEGAAFGNHRRLMDHLIHLGACLDDAVIGAVRGGHIDTMNALLAQGSSIHRAVLALAEMDHQSEVRRFLGQGLQQVSDGVAKMGGGIRNLFFKKKDFVQQCKEAKSDHDLNRIIEREIRIHAKKNPEYTKILAPYLLMELNCDHDNTTNEFENWVLIP